jgi:primosomal protein N' (replication factor Y)
MSATGTSRTRGAPAVRQLAPGSGPPRCVDVAVDVAGEAGSRTYAYVVPAELGVVMPGEAVIVEYGRRQALGIVLGDASPPSGIVLKPILARVHSDGPLLPPLQVALVRAVASHYLAPIAFVVRASLPPGLLERLELVASARDGLGERDSAGDPVLAQVVGGGASGIPVGRLRAEGGRAGVLRHLHSLEARGDVRLEWRLQTRSGGPRMEREVAITDGGRAALATARAGDRLPGRPLGSRQLAILAELGDARPSSGVGGPAVAETAATSFGGVPAASLTARHGAGSVRSLERRGLVLVTSVERPRRPLGTRPPGPRGARPPEANLTSAQAAALAAIVDAIRQRAPRQFLLDGVTGSGKTAVYAAAIAAALAQGRGAVVLVPEIALALPLVDRLRAELGVEVALLHGGLSAGERADEWRRVRAGEVPIVVGTRTAVLAPMGDPGIVIVDEEHDSSYKADRTPRYQARDVALLVGSLAGAPVVLGSATPDVVTVGRARAGEMERFALLDRAAGALPEIRLVDLRAELAAGNRGLLSSPLVASLRGLDTVAGDRAILVMNRRGSATVVVCRDCGYVQVCPECRRPLVYHAAFEALRCHECGATAPLARRCPACGSARIRYLGGGTERLEREVRERLPGMRVARLDRDVAARRGAAARVLDAFRDGALDVLVGTGLVAKGIDVPEVTLVGVVSADIALNLPDLRAAERTYQLLVQAVGRAGRGSTPGSAIVQTYQPSHPVLQALVHGDSEAFYDAELNARRAFRAPPFGRLLKLTCSLEDRDRAAAEAARFAGVLRERARASEGSTVEVLGPVPAYVPRRAGRWRFHVVLRGGDPVALLGGDPGSPWSVDVDPESLL